MVRPLAVLVVLLFLATGHLRADAQIWDWLGEYAMNHDGFHGTLRIAESRRKCTASFTASRSIRNSPKP